MGIGIVRLNGFVYQDGMRSQPFIVAALVLVLNGCGRPDQVAAGERFVSPTDPAIRYVGRWDRSDPARPKASWPGFQVSFDFSGNWLRVRMKDAGNYYNVSIDGKSHGVVGGQSGGLVTYSLAQGLEKGRHRICLQRRNISFETPTELLGFVADAGAILSPPSPPPGPRIEFVGDSFTAAEGNEASASSLPWKEKYPVTNFDLGYACRLARALDGELTAVCRSGSGLVSDFKGDRRSPMEERYGWALMEDSGGGQARPDPADLVVICLGLNDFTAMTQGKGQPSPEEAREFQDAYHRLIGKVGLHHPTARIVALAPFIPWLREQTRKVVEEEKSKGNHRVHYAQFDEFPGGYVADGHPTVETHRRMAEQILDQLSRQALVAPVSTRKD